MEIHRPDKGEVIGIEPPQFRVVEKDERSFWKKLLDHIKGTISVYGVQPNDELWVKVRYLGLIDGEHKFWVI